MKISSLILLVLLAVGFVGCETVRNDVHDRFVAPQYQVKAIATDQHKAFDLARAALKKMNYTFERGGPAQGLIHAFGPLDASQGGGPGTARQVLCDVKLSPAVEGGTKIEVLFSRMVEDDFNKRPGQGSIRPLRDTSLYDVFFGYVDELLKAGN